MTDKQIIIDEQMENLNNLATQQLKRIEEEKREIEHIAKTHLVETFDMQREIDKLKKELQAKEQECEELKEAQKNSRCAWKSFEGTFCPEAQEQLDQLKAELEQEKALKETYLACYKAKHEDIEGKLFKLSKTLTEIKEIAEHCMQQDICTTCDNSDRCHIEDEEIPTYDVCKLILQKISECEGNYD